MVNSERSGPSISAQLLLLGFVAASQPALEAKAQQPDLFGRWEAVARSKGGIGVTWGIVAGGTLVETFGAMVDGTYRLEGDRLLIRMADSPEEAALSFQVLGDSMIQTASDGKQRKVLHRVDGKLEGPASISGRWSYRHYAGGIASEEYTPGGQFRFRLPFRFETHAYTLNGDTLAMSSPDAPNRSRWRVSVTDSLLTLSSFNGRNVRVFRRVQP